MNNDVRNADVIILGGGAAGLEAASALARSGLNVAILEARDRLGGRIDTRHAADDAKIVVERGAEFVHGRARETFDLIKAGKLDVVKLDEEHLRFNGQWSDCGQWCDDDSWEQVEELMSRLEREESVDETFADFLAREGRDLSPSVRAMAIAFVEGFNAADQHKIGTLGLVESQRESERIEADTSFRLPGGYDQLVRVLVESLPLNRVAIHTGTVVTNVRWSAGHVEVETVTSTGERSTFTARAAIVTLPLGVLKAPVGSPGAVRFEPELTEKRESLDHLIMGDVVKVVMRFRTAFWRDSHPKLSFVHALDEAIPTWWTQSPIDVPLLTCWAGGAQAAKLVTMTDAAIVDVALQVASRIFHRSGLRELLVTADVSDWHCDPFSRGAYSYVAVGGVHAADELARPIADTLYFAGEATHAGLCGTVAGAVASGYRAAKELLDR